VLAHTSLVAGLDFSHLGFLIRRQNRHDFGPDACMRNLEFDNGLGILRRQRASLAFVEGAACLKSLHGSMVLAHLLHQRLHGRFFFFPDRLNLGLLIGGQVELPQHVVELARPTVTVHTLGNRGCHSQQYYNAADADNSDPSRFNLTKHNWYTFIS
jgi:hypothetical protein